MQYQTYENSYRVRSHWHFIDSLTPKKVILPKKNTPNTVERDQGNNKNIPHSPSSKQKSPVSDSRDRLAKLKDRSFVSRIKKEKEKVASKQYLSKQGNAQREKEAQEEERDWQSYRQDRSGKRFVKFYPKGQNQNGERDRMRQQNGQKTPVLKPKKQATTQTPKRRGSQPYPEDKQTPPPIKRGKFDGKQRSKSMGDQYLSSPIQKYLYLSIQDERRISGIYQKINRLRVIDSPQ